MDWVDWEARPDALTVRYRIADVPTPCVCQTTCTVPSSVRAKDNWSMIDRLAPVNLLHEGSATAGDCQLRKRTSAAEQILLVKLVPDGMWVYLCAWCATSVGLSLAPAWPRWAVRALDDKPDATRARSGHRTRDGARRPPAPAALVPVSGCGPPIVLVQELQPWRQ